MVRSWVPPTFAEEKGKDLGCKHRCASARVYAKLTF